MHTRSDIEIKSRIYVSIKVKELEPADMFKYLCRIPNKSTKSEFNLRKKAIKFAFREYQMHIFRDISLSITLRLHIYSVLVLSTILYGCTLWRFERNKMNKLKIEHYSHLRYIIPSVNRTSSFQDLIVTATRKL